jgi:hypothetical protein
VIAGDDPEHAAGLTQILAETATNFLGMTVDLTASRQLTRRIEEARRRGDGEAVEALLAERRRVDARFDPAQALAATVRYLTEARRWFGREDLALVSYHMGIGNLESAPLVVVAATLGKGLGALGKVAQLHDPRVVDGEDGEELAMQLDAGELLAGLVVDAENDVVVVVTSSSASTWCGLAGLARSQASTWSRLRQAIEPATSTQMTSGWKRSASESMSLRRSASIQSSTSSRLASVWS